MPIRVLIGDDHPVVREGLRSEIERSGTDIRVVAEAADGLEVLREAKLHHPDVYLIDITMPNMNGIDATMAILKINPHARIIILSLHDSAAMVNASIRAGARGYLTKLSAICFIVPAIKAVHGGQYYISPDIANGVLDELTRPPQRTPAVDLFSSLTTNERVILQMIAEGRTSAMIASMMGRSPNTIRTHRKHLMVKLGVHKQSDLVRVAIREGLAKA